MTEAKIKISHPTRASHFVSTIRQRSRDRWPLCKALKAAGQRCGQPKARRSSICLHSQHKHESHPPSAEQHSLE